MLSAKKPTDFDKVLDFLKNEKDKLSRNKFDFVEREAQGSETVDPATRDEMKKIFDSDSSLPISEFFKKQTENIPVLVSKVNDLCVKKQFSEALNAAHQLKILISRSGADPVTKMHCLLAINENLLMLDQVNNNENEIVENFEEMRQLIEKHSVSFMQQLKFQEYVNIMNQLYCNHVDIFIKLSGMGWDINTDKKTEYFKKFIFCGINGIKINKNHKQNQVHFAKILNQNVAKPFRISLLPVTGQISSVELSVWEEQLAPASRDFLCTYNPGYLYRKAIQAIRNHGYSTHAQEELEVALRHSNIMIANLKMECTLLLARCYEKNNIAKAAKTYQAAINMIVEHFKKTTPSVKDPSQFPEVWSLHLECGLALLKENRLDSALKEFKKALDKGNYFKENRNFFDIDSVSILTSIAAYLVEYAKKSTEADKVSLESLVNRVAELNVPKIQFVTESVMIARDKIDKINQTLELEAKKHKKENPDVLTKVSVPAAKTAEQLKAERAEEAKAFEQERIRVAKNKEKELAKNRIKQEQLALKKLEEEKEKMEEEKQKREAIKP